MAPDFERMKEWAGAAAGHPTWSVAYAEDVPLLLAEIERLRSTDDRSHRMRKAETDLTLACAEVVRLRTWLDRIRRYAEDQPLQAWTVSVAEWATQALAGEKP
jgi:hypothetical protein